MLLTGLDMLELSAIVLWSSQVPLATIVVRSSAHERGKFHRFELLEFRFCVIHYSVTVHYFNVIKVD